MAQYGARSALYCVILRRPSYAPRVKLDGFQMVISELEVEQDYLRRAMHYLED
jgi:hypothetical protein